MTGTFRDPSTRFADRGGIAADHPTANGAYLLAPSVDRRELNTLRLPLLPIACFRLNERRFTLGSSFIGPAIDRDIEQLAALVASHPGAPAAIFGHADPTGSDEHNKALSGRRALAVYGLLVRDAAVWERLFSTPVPGDQWGFQAIEQMLRRVDGSMEASRRPTATSGGPISMIPDAIRRFQVAQALDADGVAGPPTRLALFRVYMDALAGAFVMRPEDFLGRGADGLKGSCQGCGEFNPVLVSPPSDRLDSETRDERNAPNRRVLLYFFRPGTAVAATKWPCPTADEGAEGCRSRFWPDGEKRRMPGGREREYRFTRDTFACRFYDGFARWSPCEGVVVRDVRIRLFDNLDRPMPRAKYLARVAGREQHGDADGVGDIVLKRVVPPAHIQLQWRIEPEQDDPGRDDPDERLFEYRREVFITAEDFDTNEGARRRLHNLGYTGASTLDGNVRAFQSDYNIPVSGSPGDAELTLLTAHDDAQVKPYDDPWADLRIDNNP